MHMYRTRFPYSGYSADFRSGDWKMGESQNLGYEHRYGFRLDEDIIPGFKYTRKGSRKSLLFEVRTNFIVRPIEEEEKIIGSEVLHAHVQATMEEIKGEVKDTKASRLRCLIRDRLMDYWVSAAGIRRLTEDVVCFAREKALHEPRRDVIPVIIDFDVCTVQQAGEALCAAEDRAIRPEHMVPIYVSTSYGVRPPMLPHVFLYLMRMRRIRVKNVDEGLILMGECRICGRVPTLGAQISLLKCRHAFHSHCLVTWLLQEAASTWLLREGASCPECGAKESLIRANLLLASTTGDGFKRKSAVCEENCPKESLKRANLLLASTTGDDFKRQSAVCEENCP